MTADPGCPFLVLVSRPGHCDRCGEALKGNRRRWCSEKCERAYWANHAWTMARHEAWVRASGLSREQLDELWRTDRLTLRELARCDECGATERDLPYPQGLEVNHVDPRLGAGYDNGCWNHQTNLQVLCHPCHVVETNRQRHERMPDRPAVVARPERPPMDSLWELAS